MIGWIQQNVALLQAGVSLLTAAVWIIYLQLIYVGYRRQRRSAILVAIGAGRGWDARCFVCNLGMEPIYVADVLARLETEERAETAVVTDRDEWAAENLDRPGDATNQGPLKSGEFADIGSYRDIAERAARSLGRPEPGEELRGLELTVAGVTAANATIVAAARGFDVIGEGTERRLKPRTLFTRQIRSSRDRRRIRKELARRL